MNEIPIYLKTSADMARPQDPEFYWMTASGLFLGRNHRFFTSDVPAPRAPQHLATHQSRCRVNYPKLGSAALEYIVGFFDLVFQRHGSESIVLLFWDPRRKRYKLSVPKQTATVWESGSGYRSALDVTYQVPVSMLSTHLLIADIHCHCDFSAYASQTDKHDERYRDGVHAVVGQIDREPPQFHLDISLDGSRFQMRFDQMFKGYTRRRRSIPRRWLDQVTVRVNRPKSYYDQPHQGHTPSNDGYSGRRNWRWDT